MGKFMEAFIELCKIPMEFEYKRIKCDNIDELKEIMKSKEPIKLEKKQQKLIE